MNWTDRLAGLKTWHFVAISIALSEIFTAGMNSAIGSLWLGGFSMDLVLIGSLDAFVVALLVSAFISVLIRESATINLEKTALEREIAERRRAEAELKKERAFINIALDSLTEVFFVLDASGKIIRWNKAAREATGYSDEEISRMAPGDFFVPGERGRVGSIVAEVIGGREARGVELTCATKDGRQIPYEFSARLMVGGQGEILGLCGMGRDISVRKAAEEAMRVYRERLEELVEMRTAELRRSNELLQKEVSERAESEAALRHVLEEAREERNRLSAQLDAIRQKPCQP
ncbi:MAG: hypothetical protein Kow0025_18980 [Thermodesulfovibrionales bacterium]